MTVLGGIHATFMYQQVLTEAPWIDAIVRGEGEEILVELVRADRGGRLAGTTATTIKGIAFIEIDRRGRADRRDRGRRRRSRTSTRSTPTGASWSGRKYNYIPLNCRVAIPNMARGCPFTCSFCSQWKFWRDYRVRDPKKVVDEIETLYKKYDVRFFILADEEPTINRKKFVAVLRGTDRARPARQGAVGHQHPRHRHPARRGAAAALSQGRPDPRLARHRGGGAAEARPLQQGDQGRRQQAGDPACCARPASSSRRSSSSAWRTRPPRRWKKPTGWRRTGSPTSPTGRCTRPGRSPSCSRN